MIPIADGIMIEWGSVAVDCLDVRTVILCVLPCGEMLESRRMQNHI